METKYIFVTGGVVSSLGKGITAASIGRVLKSRGLEVTIQKLDPYINVDPGTMAPNQHGEVFVTEDGAETDLDLGHYERFIDENLTRNSNVTTGQIYASVISKERKGEYLGGTIQVIPHITDEMKERILRTTKRGNPRVVIVEVGGTVGDIESLPFLEAIRQMRNEVGRNNVLYIHVTLLPHIGATDELKTKPTQHSVNELRRIGIQPDILICRADHDVSPPLREKISLFGDVRREAVIPLPTCRTIYEVPLVLERAGLGRLIVEELGLGDEPGIHDPDLDGWGDLVEHIKQERPVLRIALVGKYVKSADAYISIVEALRHSALHEGYDVQIDPVDSEDLEKHPEAALQHLAHADGVVVGPGFGPRGVEGKIRAATFCIERKLPYLGLCLGMQVAVIAFARLALSDAAANSTEFDSATTRAVIDIMPDQRTISDKGGTMRLGAWPCELAPGTKTFEAYGEASIRERHRHRYEFNNQFRDVLAEKGMVFSGLSPDGRLVEIVELADHPWLVGTQFHPEFKSRIDRPHPLFCSFIRAAGTLRFQVERDVGELERVFESAEPLPAPALASQPSA
jgi:CTP synthase